MLTSLARHDVKSRYGGVLGVFGELIGIVIELVIFWYTSKAFFPNFEINPANTAMIGSYFAFIVTGEMAIIIPSKIIDSCSEPIRSCRNHDMLESVFVSGFGVSRFMALFSLSTLFREILRMTVFITIITMFFDMKFGIVGIFLFAFVQLMLLPMSLMIGMLLSLMMIVFGRGYAVTNKIILLLVVFSGAYFPHSVLPESFRHIASDFTPFSTIVSLSRSGLGGELSTSQLQTLGMISVLSAVFCYLAVLLVDFAFRKKIRTDQKIYV